MTVEIKTSTVITCTACGYAQRVQMVMMP